MADEQNPPEQADDLLEPPVLAPVDEEKKEETPSIEPFVKEPEQIMDPEVFWSNIDSQTRAVVNTASGKPIKALYAPESSTGPITFSGAVSFAAFPDSGRPFNGHIKLLPGSDEKKPKVSLVLECGGIMEAVARAIKRYNEPGPEGRILMQKAREGVEPNLVTVFEHVFNAIKEKSPELQWSHLPKSYGGGGIPLVELIYNGIDDKDLDWTLRSAFDNKKSEIRAAAEAILPSEEKEDTSPAGYRLREATIRKFISSIPEEKFKPTPQRTMMVAVMTIEEAESIGGKEAADIIRNTPKVKNLAGWHEDSDGHSYWYRYDPETKVVMAESKRITDQMLIRRLQGIWDDHYNPGTSLFDNIAKAYDVSTESVKEWFKKFTEKLSPAKKEKVEEILKEKTDGVKKVGYPAQAWAGPILDQIGALVGDAEAAWASELAGNLAARFDYISYPRLEGGSSDLKKLATLPLTPEQIARVERFNVKAKQILAQLYASRPAYADEDAQLHQPEREDLTRLAEDVLLETVEAFPSSMSDNEFEKELKHALYSSVTKIHQHPYAHWPDTKSNPEDVLQSPTDPYDTVTEMPDFEESIQKKALLHEDDAVEVVTNHPDIPPQFYGLFGKIVDIQADFFMCPKHGPEPYIRYLVELQDGRTAWFRADQLNETGTTN